MNPTTTNVGSLQALRFAAWKQCTRRHILPTRRILHTTTLECERKFNVTPIGETFLRGGSSKNPTELRPRPKLEFTYQGAQTIRDQYLDHEGRLVSRGIWLRKRIEPSLHPSPDQDIGNITLEAKKRIGGDYNDSQFEEISGQDAVRRLLWATIPGLDLHDLVIFADLETSRQIWIVAEKPSSRFEEYLTFQVVVDTCTSGDVPGWRHVVGEVERTWIQMVRDGKDRMSEDEKKRTLEGIREELGGFMKRHSNVFPVEPKPIGKLTAYFSAKKAMG